MLCIQTKVPALRSFCITAGIGIIITLVPVISVFPGVLLLNETLTRGRVDQRKSSEDTRVVAPGAASSPSCPLSGSGRRAEDLNNQAVDSSSGAHIFSLDGYVQILRYRAVQVCVCLVYLTVLAAR